MAQIILEKGGLDIYFILFVLGYRIYWYSLQQFIQITVGLFLLCLFACFVLFSKIKNILLYQPNGVLKI